jgi:HSP20 family protein
MTLYIQPYPFRRMARRWMEPRGAATTDRYLGVDIREEEEAYVLSAFVPGLKADELNIQVLEDVVRIEGEYKTGEGEYLLQELPSGSFHRSLRLPAAVETDHVEAKITDGVLTLRLPKAESARPKKIKVAAK